MILSDIRHRRPGRLLSAVVITHMRLQRLMGGAAWCPSAVAERGMVASFSA